MSEVTDEHTTMSNDTEKCDASEMTDGDSTAEKCDASEMTDADSTTEKYDVSEMTDGDSTTEKCDASEIIDGNSTTEKCDASEMTDGDSTTEKCDASEITDGDSTTEKCDASEIIDGNSTMEKCDASEMTDGDSTTEKCDASEITDGDSTAEKCDALEITDGDSTAEKCKASEMTDGNSTAEKCDESEMTVGDSTTEKCNTSEMTIADSTTEKCDTSETTFGDSTTEKCDASETTDGDSTTEMYDASEMAVGDSTAAKCDASETTVGVSTAEKCDTSETTFGDSTTEKCDASEMRVGDSTTDKCDTSEMTVGDSTTEWYDASETTVGDSTMDEKCVIVKESSNGDVSTHKHDFSDHLDTIHLGIDSTMPRNVGEEGEADDVIIPKTPEKQNPISKPYKKVKKHICTQCSKSFKQWNHLKLHMVWHMRRDSAESGIDSTKDDHERSKDSRERSKDGFERSSVKKQSTTGRKQCEICRKTFGCKNALTLHTQSVHLEIRPYQCPYCPSRFSQKGNCESHKRRRHRGVKAKNDGNNIQLNEQLDNHCNGPVSTKPVMQGGLNSPKSENASIPGIHYEKRYKCITCGKKFKCKERRDKHQEKHKSATVKQEEKDVGNLRDGPIAEIATAVRSRRKYSQTEDLWEKDPATGLYKCSVCNKTFAGVGNVRRHHRTLHLGDYPVSCPICKKGFNDARPIQKHMAVMHPDGKARFPQAIHKKSSCKALDQISEKTNSGEAKPLKKLKSKTDERIEKNIEKNSVTGLFECRLCNKSGFRYAYSVRIHIRCVHLNLRPFICSTCGKAFSLREGWKRHQKLVHGTSVKSTPPPSSVKVKPQKAPKIHYKIKQNLSKDAAFFCRICGSGFRLKWNCRRHERTVHGRPLSPIQSQRFSFKVKHDKPKKNRKVKPYVCLTCGKGFTQESNYNRHHTLLHPKDRLLVRPIRNGGVAINNECDESEKTVDDKPYKCRTCGKGFLYRYNCKKHQKFEHQVERPSKRKAFNTSSSVKVAYLNDMMYMCPVCDKTFKSKETCQTHQKHRHLQGYQQFLPRDNKTVCDPSHESARSVISTNSEGHAFTPSSPSQSSNIDYDTAEMNVATISDKSFSENEMIEANPFNTKRSIGSANCKIKNDGVVMEEGTSVDCSDHMDEVVVNTSGEGKAMASITSSNDKSTEKDRTSREATRELPSVSSKGKGIMESTDCSDDDDYGFEYDDDDDGDDYGYSSGEETQMSVSSKDLNNVDKSQKCNTQESLLEKPSSSKDSSANSFSISSPKPEWVYHCPACSKGFERSIDLVMHIKSHMEQSKGS